MSSPDHNAQPRADAQTQDLLGYWRMIRKRWRLALTCVVVSTVVAGVWTYRQPKIYQATATLVIDPMAPQVLQGVKDVVELGTGSYWANKEFYETQYRVMKSKEIARRVVTRLGLADDPNYPVPKLKQAQGAPPAPPLPVDRLADIVIGSTTIAPVKDSRIVNLVISDRIPERAAQIANALAESYMEQNLDNRMEGSKSASVWLGDQAVDLSRKLRASELQLYEYRSKNQLLDVDLGARQSMTAQNLATYNGKLADLRSQKISLEAALELITGARGDIAKKEILPQIQDNDVIQQLRINYLELAKNKADLESRYGAKHPRITAIADQMANFQEDYRAEIDRVLDGTAKAFEAAVLGEKKLRALMEQEKKAALDLAGLEIGYLPLEREKEESKKLYEIVTQREKETGLAGLVRSNNVRLLDRAVPIKAPVKPRFLLGLLSGLMVGLIAGIAAALSLEILDKSIGSQEDAEALLGIPVLGLIPVIGEKVRGKEDKSPLDRDLGVFKSPKSSAAEACRSIRTNLLFLSPDDPIKVLVVTSPGPQEGKTTTAISLAITMAQAGTRVLLVDTDLRRPRIHKSFGLANSQGVANVVVGDCSLEEATRTTEVPNLSILTSGPIPPNPAELLHTKRFAKLVQDSRTAYDFVLFDSPPTSAVTDPAIVGNLSDGVILVIRAQRTSREAALFAKRQLTDARARLLGSIVNHVDLSDRAYGYYYRRYYKNGYEAYSS